jgi:hypothetical protein
MFCWAELSCWAKALDIALVCILIFIVFFWSVKWKSGPKANESDTTERQLGASTISSQLSLGMTAASILLPSCFVIIALGREAKEPLSVPTTTQVIIAAVWFTVAIVVGFWNAARVPTLVGKYNIAREGMTNVFCAAQLFMTMFGAGILLSALFLI